MNNKLTFKNSAPFIILCIVAIGAAFTPALPNFDDGKYNVADIAWIIVATALGVFNDAGSSLFLRWHGKQEECAFYHDEKRGSCRCCRRLVDYCWL